MSYVGQLMFACDHSLSILPVVDQQERYHPAVSQSAFHSQYAVHHETLGRAVTD